MASAHSPMQGEQDAPRWRRLPRLGGGTIALLTGSVMLAVLVVACVGAPLFTSYSPTALDPAAALQAPSADHWFGTDQYGQDVFTRTLYAGRVDLLIGIVLVGTALCIGTCVGLISAWRQGWVDVVTQRVIDVGFAFPFLVLIIAMVGLLGAGLSSLFIAVGLVAWIFYARLVRSEVLIAKQQDYITAARVSGFSTPRILIRHLLPTVSGQLLVYATADFVYAVLLGASVSYLGLGVQPPTPEWGAMIQSGQNFVANEWWISFFPGMAIVYLGVALALMGDGLADLLRAGRSHQ